MWKYTCEKGICKVVFSTDAIEAILNTLIYDGQVGRAIVTANAGTVDDVGRM